MRTVRIVVEGVLRGTGFKAHVYLLAKKLGLSGYIMDVDEGKELICIEGEERQISKFLENLRKGPPFTLINSIMVLESSESCSSSTFNVRYREF